MFIHFDRIQNVTDPLMDRQTPHDSLHRIAWQKANKKLALLAHFYTTR